MTPRDRYLLDQAPGLVRTALDLESLDDDPFQVLKPAPDLPERAVARALALAGAIYDQVMGAEAVLVGAASAATDQAPCPHQDIINLYHKLLPLCPRVRSWTSQRQALLRSRWREHPDLDWWRGYLSHVAESAFLTGRAPPAPGRQPFLADLEWLVRPANMARVYEGKYHE